MRGLGGITDSLDLTLENLWEMVRDRDRDWCAAVHGVKEELTRLGTEQ